MLYIIYQLASQHRRTLNLSEGKKGKGVQTKIKLETSVRRNAPLTVSVKYPTPIGFA